MRRADADRTELEFRNAADRPRGRNPEEEEEGIGKMLTLKFVSSPAEELVFEAASVRRDGDNVYYANEHGVEVVMCDLAGKDIYIMNEKGATVSTYRL